MNIIKKLKQKINDYTSIDGFLENKEKNNIYSVDELETKLEELKYSYETNQIQQEQMLSTMNYLNNEISKRKESTEFLPKTITNNYKNN